MSKIDLSTEALQKRREIAEKATPGPWETRKPKPGWGICVGQEEFYVDQGNGSLQIVCQIKTEKDCYRLNEDKKGYLTRKEARQRDADHIATNSPDAIIAMIDEIERLRKENQELQERLK